MTSRLDALVAEARASYAELKRAAEGRVVRTEWTLGPLYEAEPAYFEVNKMRRGERLAHVPTDPSHARQYGFDAEGRVVVERAPVAIGGQWRAYETFLRHEAEGTARFHFGYDEKKAWINCAWIDLGPHGVDVVSTAYANGSRLVATYTYGENDRVRSIELRRSPASGPESVEHRDLSYDQAGNISRVMWRTDQGATHLHYELPAEADRLVAAEPRLLAGLADAIAAALAEAHFEDPIAAIVFATSGADYHHRFPPLVTVATQRELRRVRDELGPEGLSSLWSPAEWDDAELEVPLDDALKALCASVSQDIWQNDLDAQADHALLRLAAAIEARELPLTRAEPFVVAVVEVDGAEEPGTQIAGQVGQEMREELRRVGLL